MPKRRSRRHRRGRGIGRVLPALKALVWTAAAVAAGWVGYAFLKGQPENLPWTKLDLSQPVGLFTGRKLAALGEDAGACRGLLDRAGVDYVPLPPVSRQSDGLSCGYADAVRLTANPGEPRWSPAGVAPSCPVAAALKLWEWHVVQPAAHRHFGQPVRVIEHFGSYSCRRMYGRSTGDVSEHASANAIDVAGFVLADGRRIRVVRDWRVRDGGKSGVDASPRSQGDGASGAADGRDVASAFLHDVRDGACDLFSTVLSPDYNAAHRDHLHFDQAVRGAMGRRACR